MLDNQLNPVSCLGHIILWQTDAQQSPRFEQACQSLQLGGKGGNMVAKLATDPDAVIGQHRMYLLDMTDAYRLSDLLRGELGLYQSGLAGGYHMAQLAKMRQIFAAAAIGVEQVSLFG
ncbi:hypothetical protein LCR_07990 [Aeromonas enteropelogenes]|uniref:Uncharacterized protein n=1 Tax=Aeromonas enteropelogenes TaxID=29489 RepID=A0A175VLW9_AEREN|nr:hypothetical protein LCR_07990 [Aeromonas enteropelogenes]